MLGFRRGFFANKRAIMSQVHKMGGGGGGESFERHHIRHQHKPRYALHKKSSWVYLDTLFEKPRSRQWHMSPIRLQKEEESKRRGTWRSEASRCCNMDRGAVRTSSTVCPLLRSSSGPGAAVPGPLLPSPPHLPVTGTRWWRGWPSGSDHCQLTDPSAAVLSSFLAAKVS